MYIQKFMFLIYINNKINNITNSKQAYSSISKEISKDISINNKYINEEYPLKTKQLFVKTDNYIPILTKKHLIFNKVHKKLCFNGEIVRTENKLFEGTNSKHPNLYGSDDDNLIFTYYRSSQKVNIPNTKEYDYNYQGLDYILSIYYNYICHIKKMCPLTETKYNITIIGGLSSLAESIKGGKRKLTKKRRKNNKKQTKRRLRTMLTK